MRRRDERFTLLAVFAAGLLTFLPSLRSPFVLDDYLHRSMVCGTFPAPRGPFDLYDFVNDKDRPVLLAHGILPWWTHPRLTIRFWRPLSSALLWMDHSLVGRRPLLLHVQSLAFWVLAVLAARALFRRSFAPRVTLMATAIFALGAWHAVPLAWLANSEALVSLALGTIALGAHVRWQEGRRLRDGALATGLFALALLGGEYALCFGGYVLALAIVHRREGWGRSAVSLAPFVVPAIAYLTIRGALGYGTVASGFYEDPLREPLAFVHSAPLRLVALLADGWLTISADTWGVGSGRWAAAAIAVATAAVLSVPLRPTLAELPDKQRATATWMLGGSLLAMVPVLAVVPAARLLGVSALGIAVTVALVVDRAWFPAQPAPRTGAGALAGLVAVLLGFAHLVHGPATAWLTGRHMREQALDFISHTAWLRARVADPASAEVIVVRAGGGMFFGPFSLDPDGRPPARWRTLSHTGHALVLRRDARTLDIVAPPGSSIFPAGWGNLFRSPGLPLVTGDAVDVPGMRARILATGENGPTRVRFAFDRDLDSPSLVWTAEDSYGFREATIPKPGFGAPFDP